MEREQFHTLLINFAALTEAESGELIKLSKEFPYSQVIHNLSARVAQDCALSSKEKLLHTSAIYSTDRSALKMVMTSPRRKKAEAVPTIEPLPIKEEVQKTTVEPGIKVEESGDQLREQVLLDLASLQESKRLFEMTIARLEKEKAQPLTVKKETPTISKPKEVDSLIEEIKSTKKKIKPEGVKQKEQIEIIDQFIKTQPTISRPKPTAPPAPDSDLAEPSAQFGENIVSETLVEILLKQGKKEKAIEALKKLIWKFPQKKAYFAAQIEELRK
ncbi:MAG TPA: hypothetical protein VGQ59_00855 [Cyclobacteriaceae bacterium]|nr:hypothetical protein [Cyclobacteriaceae bacterium]